MSDVGMAVLKNAVKY